MDENIGSNVAVLAILDDQRNLISDAVYKSDIPITTYDHSQAVTQEETIINETSKQTSNDGVNSSIPSIENEQTTEERNSESTKQDSHVIWTTHATSTLLKLYEEKLEMLQTPKKKTKIWIAISENFKEHDIDVTPDQVRWKINALTKKYKQCINMGKHEKFKYFKEMDKIYGKYNVDCDSHLITEFLSNKKTNNERENDSINTVPESKAMVEMRKARLANRLNCVRFQEKNKLEKQWLEYLNKQEEQKQFRDNIFERNLKLRKEKLKTRKQVLEMKELFENKKLQLMEKELEDFLQMEKEKLELLKQIR